MTILRRVLIVAALIFLTGMLICLGWSVLLGVAPTPRQPDPHHQRLGFFCMLAYIACHAGAVFVSHRD
jgi:uncharacterized membrane protein YdjX (TVP38/TMEM64 family)